MDNNLNYVSDVKSAIKSANVMDTPVVLKLPKKQDDNLVFKFTKLDKNAYRKVFDTLLEKPVDIHKALNSINYKSKLNESIYVLGHIEGKPLTKNFENYNLYEVTCTDESSLVKNKSLSTMFGDTV